MTKVDQRKEAFESIIQHDDAVWRVLSRGATRDGETYCHLASVHQFRQQKNGRVPVQIVDWVPNAILARARIVRVGGQVERVEPSLVSVPFIVDELPMLVSRQDELNRCCAMSING